MFSDSVTDSKSELKQRISIKEKRRSLDQITIYPKKIQVKSSTEFSLFEKIFRFAMIFEQFLFTLVNMNLA